MKNNTLSLILAFVLIAVQLTVPVMVSATDVPEPVFTLDLSEYTNENQVIKNGALKTPSSAGITVLNAKTGVAPTVKTYYTAEGEEVLAFQAANDDTAMNETGIDVLGAIKIDADTINSFLGEMGDKEMTVTYWGKTYRKGAQSRLNYADDGDVTYKGSITTYNQANWEECRVAGQSTINKGYAYVSSSPLNAWTFFAISKKWTETTTGNGTWTYTFFFGDSVKSGATKEIAYTDSSEMEMFIGARGTDFSATTQHSYRGEIAGFNIYNKALTQEQIESIKTAQNYTSLKTELRKFAFVDGNYKEVTSLDDRTSVKLEYNTSNDDEIRIVAGCYDEEGVLLEAFSKVVTDSDEIDVNIPVGTVSVKGFAWDNETLAPVQKTISIGFSDSYNPSAVKAEIDFYDSTNNSIECMDGKTGIHAKAMLNSFIPPKGIKAELKLMRNGENVFAETKDVVFDGRSGEVKIDLTDGLVMSDDELVFTIYDSERIYETKTLKYEDLSRIVDVILIAGQSNALGQEGNATQSIKPELGTVYYNTMGDNTLATSGNKGWDSALGKTWHDLTGHTVLIVKATWGATGFPTKPNLETGVSITYGSDKYGWWNPGNSGSLTSTPRDCYTLAKNKYVAAVESIDTDKYTIGDCLYFWNQGENENDSYTAAMYEESFLELHEKFTAEFGTEETRITHGGIFPVRSTYNKNELPNLKLTGPRIAHYKMAREHNDIIIASNITESWYSDASITDWFQKEYEGITYPLGTLPVKWSDIIKSDNVHYLQGAMNEMGEDAALSMYQYLYGTDSPTGIDLVTPNGIKHYKNGDEIILDADGGIPIIPTNVGAEATFSVSGNVASIDTNGILKPNGAKTGYSVLTVTPTKGSAMTFKVYSSVNDSRITISDIKDNKNAIYCLTTDDGFSYTNKWLDSKLEEYNMVATMGIVTGWIDNPKMPEMLTWEDAENLVKTGHWGVANHTKNHKQGTFSSLTEAELKDEINGGQEILRQHFPSLPLVTMYTPGGITSTLIKSVVNEKHDILRAAGGGSMTLPLTENSMLATICNPVGERYNTTAEVMNGWIDTGIENGSLIVEMWHGIGDTDAADWKGNCPEEDAEMHIKYVAEKMNEGKLWVATLDDVATYTIQKLKSKVGIVSETENQVVLSLTDDLEDSIYKSELTLNFLMPSGYTKATASMDGKSINATVVDGKVSVTVKPDIGNITINFVK